MEFEKRFAEWQGSKYAVSTATGTAALHVCLAALGIGPGDEVIVPSYTFIATSFSVVQAGRDSTLRRREHRGPLHQRRIGGEAGHRRTKAIMPVHLYGNVCDMDKINAFAKKHNLFVIEDNAEAFGGSYKGKKTGTLGHMAAVAVSARIRPSPPAARAAWSPPTTKNLAWEARSFRDHGYDVKERLNLLELWNRSCPTSTTAWAGIIE